MNFEKTLIGNFRTNSKYMVYLVNYYFPALFAIQVNLGAKDEDGFNKGFILDQRAKQFKSERFVECILRSPTAKTYSAITKIILKELSDQSKQLYGEAEENKTAQEIISIYQSIYDGIEQLPLIEKNVIKILFTPDHSELAKKYLQFTNVIGLRMSAKEKLQNILSHEEYLYFDDWLNRVSETIAG